MFKGEKILYIITGCLIIGILIFLVTLFSIPTSQNVQATPDSDPLFNSTPNPTIRQATATPQVKAARTEIKIVSFQGKHISFQHPSNWSTQIITSPSSIIKESIALGIPDLATDQEIICTTQSLEELKQSDIIEENAIKIADQDGFKWVRHGEGYFSYDYYAKDPTSNGSCGLHVTTTERDFDLEKQLDTLVNTITFSN